MNKTLRGLLLVSSVLSSSVAATPALAEENLWLYTTGTDTRPEGSYELKLSNISRIGKDSGQYAFHDIRPEIEYGITDKLTIGAGLMIFDHDYSVDDPNLNPMFDTQTAAGGTFNDTQFAGYEIMAKYNILSPYIDPVGLSIGFGYEHRDKYRLDGSDINQDSYVNTIFLQKNWLNNKLTLAGNFKTEFERRKSTDVLEEEFAFDVSVGVAYRFLPKHFIGFEYRRQQDHLSPYNTATDAYDDSSLDPSELDISEVNIGTRHQYGEYIGPSYHYAEKNWWVTTGILMQVNGGGKRGNAFISNSKNYDEHEEVHIGVSYGYNF